jgi:uncharacterized protein YndB with AHSA1/START domain
MALETIEVSTVLPASAERIFKAWLDSAEHSAFTGGQATVDPAVGGRHTAWDGYIEGVTIEIEPSRRIVQSWRSEDFPEESADSRLEIHLEEVGEGSTKLTIVHSDIPEGQGEEYRRGWIDNYFTPMARYFGGGAESPKSIWEAAAGGEEDVGGGEEEEEESDYAEPSTPVAQPFVAAEESEAEEELRADLETEEDEEEAPAPVKAKPKAKAKPQAKAKPKAKAKAKKPAAAKATAKPKAKAKPKAAKGKAAKGKAAKGKAAKAKAKPRAKPKAKAKAKPKAKPKKAAKKKR